MVGQEEGVKRFPAREARRDFDHAPFCVKLKKKSGKICHCFVISLHTTQILIVGSVIIINIILLTTFNNNNSYVN